MTTQHRVPATRPQNRREPSEATAHRHSCLGFVVLVAFTTTVVIANWASTHWRPALRVDCRASGHGVGRSDADLARPAARGSRRASGTRHDPARAGVSWLLATPQIASASVVAFVVSEAVDSGVYARLRTPSRLGAVMGSNIIGLVTDSALFVPLAFGSFTAVPGQVLGKTVATTLTVAVLLATKAVR
ncbi:VUT family protein [Saccharopolyspora sp. NPDC003752]